MGIMTDRLWCCSSSTLGSRANDYVKTLVTLGFWLHHSPCSLGCWTNNTLAARSLSPKLTTQSFFFIPWCQKYEIQFIYWPVLLKSLNMSDSRFEKLVMFWIWRHHYMALGRHGGGAWHKGLVLTKASSNPNSWADVANHMTRLWQTGDTGHFDRRITGEL